MKKLMKQKEKNKCFFLPLGRFCSTFFETPGTSVGARDVSTKFARLQNLANDLGDGICAYNVEASENWRSGLLKMAI